MNTNINAKSNQGPLLRVRFNSLHTIAAAALLLGGLGTARATTTIYVSNANNNNYIEKFDGNGVGSVFASSGLNNPDGLALDSARNLYVANTGQYNPSGTIQKFTTAGVGSVFASSVDAPTGLAFDTAGNLYAANAQNGSITKFTPGGVGTIFAQDPGNNSVLWSPYGLAFDSAGNLYAANFTSSTIEKFTPGGVASIFASTGLVNPEGLAFDSAGSLYVSNYGANTIEKFTPGGVGSVFANTGLTNPAGLAFDSAGNLYAANQTTNTIEMLTPGGVGSVFASSGLNSPRSIAILTVPPVIWTGTNSTSWSESGNWSGAVPGATTGTTNTDTATFNQNAPHSPLTIDAGRNVQNITFDTANVNSLTVGGNALLLTAGGTIQTTSTVVKAQTVNAPLVLEGDYTFTSGATSGSATLSFGGGITPGVTSGVTTLTLNGSNAGVNTISSILADNGGGHLAVTMSGGGVWILSRANTYSGGTTVSGGTLTTAANGSIGSGLLVVSAADTITSTLNLGSNQTVSSLSGTLSGSGTAHVNIGTRTALNVDQSTDTTFAGSVALAAGAVPGIGGGLVKSGDGTLEVQGDPSFAINSFIEVIGGKLRFNIAGGSASVGAGVVALVSNDAILELAGSVSALSSGGHRVDIINDGTAAAGLLVSGTRQQVGGIDGMGSTLVNAGSDLTANHIVQSALVIGGTAGNTGLVTIDASDASGNPLGESSGLALAGSLTPSAPFATGSPNSSNLLASDGSSARGLTLGSGAFGSSTFGGSAPAVPEPSTLLLGLLALSSFSCLSRRKRK